MQRSAGSGVQDLIWLIVAIAAGAFALLAILQVAGVVDWLTPLGLGST